MGMVGIPLLSPIHPTALKIAKKPLSDPRNHSDLQQCGPPDPLQLLQKKVPPRAEILQ